MAKNFVVLFSQWALMRSMWYSMHQSTSKLRQTCYPFECSLVSYGAVDWQVQKIVYMRPKLKKLGQSFVTLSHKDFRKKCLQSTIELLGCKMRAATAIRTVILFFKDLVERKLKFRIYHLLRFSTIFPQLSLPVSSYVSIQQQQGRNCSWDG